MNNMEIQREAIIEIVGTQYDGRAANHNPIFLQQNLILKHQSNNPYDHNAVLLLTENGKELGFFPKGYASLYAPAIDSGRYTFSIEIVKAESDPQRPILIVKIISELISHSDEEIESAILNFVQNIVNGYAQKTKEYLTFIYSKNIDVNELLSVLDSVRLIQKLLSCSKDFIEKRAINPNSDKFTPLTKESIFQYLGELKADVSYVLKKIQKAYNESLDIDDEEEYHRVQSEIRERRKRFRQYDDLLVALIDAVTSYINVTIQPHLPASDIHDAELKKATRIDEAVSTITEPEKAESIPAITNKPKPIDTTPDSLQLTEQMFFDWLLSEGGVSESTAKQYISNIHSIEKLYQTLFGIRQNILGTSSTDAVISMIETLIQRSEYIDANERRNNSFNASLYKYVQFADIYVAGLKSPLEKKNYQPPTSTKPYVLKTVDFENPQKCTYYKPSAFILNEIKYTVKSWRELYTQFLIILYKDIYFTEKLKGLIGKSLYGHTIDFADKTFKRYIRKPISISTNFFAEGNLSAIDIIKHIKHIMELCSIDDKHMIIEYYTQESDTDTVLQNNDNAYDENASADYTSEPASFVSNASKPFILKDAIIEILSSKDPEITDKKEYHNGFSLSTLKKLLEEYYGEIVVTSKLLEFLKSDKLLKYVGQGCYVLNEDMITLKAEIECNELIAPKNVIEEQKIEQQISISIVPENIPKNNVIDESDKHTSISFSADKTKPFILKDAIIEIMLSNAPEITKYHEYKEGISSKSLCKLIKEYYGKIIDLFEVSMLLILDETFLSVGKGCYIVNKDFISNIEKEPVDTTTSTVYTVDPTVMYESHTVKDTFKNKLEKELTIELILDIIEQNVDNLQYEDGFGAYEIKSLLLKKGYTNASEDEIEALMSDCSQLREIEEGYYTLAEVEDTTETNIEVSDSTDNNTEDTVVKVAESPITTSVPDEPQQVDTDATRIVLRLNGNVIRAYDYSDALNKVCEFSINYKPFRMARIAEQAIQIHGNSVFYRKTVPVDGYNKLSNGLQIITIATLSDLQMITAAVQKYCQIDDDMIAIISK